MSVEVTARLRCDHCRKPFLTPSTGSGCQTDVREKAKQQGWVRRKIGSAQLDLCIKCKDQVLSDRFMLAQSFADFLKEKGLAESSEDGNVIKDESGARPFYSILFSKGDLSGQVDIHGDTFIQIVFHNRTYEGFPVFETVDYAKMFIDTAFYRQDWVEATCIPTKPPRRAEV